MFTEVSRASPKLKELAVPLTHSSTLKKKLTRLSYESKEEVLLNKPYR